MHMMNVVGAAAIAVGLMAVAGAAVPSDGILRAQQELTKGGLEVQECKVETNCLMVNAQGLRDLLRSNKALADENRELKEGCAAKLRVLPREGRPS